MRLISQTDPRWSKIKIGKTNYTIGRWGCYICSVCMALEHFRGYDCEIKDAVKFWTFDKYGYFCPSKTKLKGAEYVGSFKPFYSKMREYTTNDKACILKVCSKNIESHFVFIKEVDPVKNIVTIVDPLGGKIKDLKDSGYTPLSLRLYKKKDI